MTESHGEGGPSDDVDAAVDAVVDVSVEQSNNLVEAVLVPPSGLVPTLLLVLFGVAAWAILSPGALEPMSRPDLSLETWKDGAVALQKEQNSVLRAHPPQPGETDIAQGLGLWLAREATQGLAALAEDPTARQQLATLEERLRAFDVAHGHDRLRAAALRWAVAVRASYEADLRTATAGGGARPAVSRIERIAPGFERALVEAGIAAWRLDDGGLMPAAARLVEAIAMQRYLGFARRVVGQPPTIGSVRQIMLLRFRVEAHVGLDLRRRLLLAEQLSALDPAWPSTWATAVLMARDGRYRAARAWFLRAVQDNERPDAARRNARWCRQRLRR